MRSFRGALLGAAIVASGTALLSVPPVLLRWWLTPDVVEHLATANHWVHGAGFVDPVQWSYYRSGDVPFPAFALRAPMVSILAAIPLALGATITTVLLLHALWASAIGGAVVLVARRSMRLPAAIGAGALFAWSPAWLDLARHLWTEATAVGGFLLVLATARGVTGSLPMALACSVATLFAWLCRPNLLALYVAVLVAAIWQLGVRRALDQPAFRAYAVITPLAVAIVYMLVVLGTGEGPYSRYAVMLEMLTKQDGFYYGKEYVGAWRFLQEHHRQVAQQVSAISVELVRALLSASYHWIGWLLLPGVAYGLVSKREGSLERRIAALSALGFAVVALATYTDFVPGRYALFTALGGILCVASLLDGLAAWLEARAGSRAARRALVVAPLVLLALLTAGTIGRDAVESLAAWSIYRRQGTLEITNPRVDVDGPIRELCVELAPGALVAAEDPWIVHLWCGNPTIKLPLDLNRPPVRRKYFLDQSPSYVVTSGGRGYGWAARSNELEELARSGKFALYAVLSRRRSRDVTPIPPLVCAGRSEACAATGRL